jgi:threonine aldolase
MATPIDLRSDAVAPPSEVMWQAMRAAPPAWSPAGDDPSVRALEAYGADLAGKEAALFAPTGTMANLAALMALVGRGEQVVLEATAHILWSEEWGLAYICGALPRAIPAADGCPDPAAVREALDGRIFSHRPRTALVCLENTHNVAGGLPLDPAQARAVAEVAHERGVPVHLDGARIMNACVALGRSLRELAADADSLTVGLSKGLGAPYGALLCGSAALVERARLALRRLGAHSLPHLGSYAAAALLALREGPARLAEDHRRARLLAEGLVGAPGLAVELGRVRTNVVLARTTPGAATRLVAAAAARGVLLTSVSDDLVRLITHGGVGDAQIAPAVAAVRAAAEELCR